MAQEHLSEQGTIAPKLFLGMGGVGSRIVNRIAMRSKSLPNWESQLQSLTAFVSIDTNLLDQNQLSIPAGNRIQIGLGQSDRQEKQEIIQGWRRAGNQQALQWLDDRYVAREEIIHGAGQIRVESRLGFFHGSPDIRDRLETLIKGMMAPANTWLQTGEFNVYLFATLAGGTGSGSFLSASYLVQDIIQRNAWRPCVIANLLLSTLMKDVVGSQLHTTIHANTYAALKELEHLTKLNYQEVHDEGRTSEEFAYWHNKSASDVTKVDSAPFHIAFIYDEPASFKLVKSVNFEQAIADASFLTYFTPNIDNFNGVYVNYQTNIAGLAKLPGDLKNVGLGYAKNYGATGVAALVLPAKDLLEYCALRFAAEAVRSQITFGVDPSSSEEDRAVALAKLAVDYSDPRFLRMGDEGRNREISQSFLNSVREMKRQDEREKLNEGFWYQLVESVDEGCEVGLDEKGQVRRSESKLGEVKRKLGQARQELLNKVSIREKAFAFHRESVSQFWELVSGLEDDIRKARGKVQEGMEGLTRSAREGEVIKDLKLDPITERYLVLRLLEECQRKWIPESEKQRDSAAHLDLINNPKVKERFQELYHSLTRAAKLTPVEHFRRNDEPFFNLRTEAEAFYHAVAAAARKIIDAEIALGQLRELLGYLEARVRLYAALARHMNTLMNNLLKQSEDLRKGQTSEPRLALSVEVFETLQEPKERIWDRVYRAVFVDGGSYLRTFDRAVLSHCIVEQLKPRAHDDGTINPKTPEETVADIRNALVKLGRERLRAAIFGDQTNPGLDLRGGLDLEAQLVLKATKLKEERVGGAEIEQYQDEKFRAVAQICGVLARVNTEKWQARQDGTKVDRTRFLMHGFGLAADSSPFVVKLKSILGEHHAQVNVKSGKWKNPHLIIVYDTIAPITLYYIDPIIDEIERAYEKEQANERRGYNLHTDYHWEESLPDLNPEKAELETSWSVKKLAEGLVAGVIIQGTDGCWFWHKNLKGAQTDSERVESLGKTLSSTLYRLGEYYRNEDLRRPLDEQIRESLGGLGTGLQQRQKSLRDIIEQALTEIALRKQHGNITQEDVLDRPILHLLIKLLEAGPAAGAARGVTRFQLPT